MQWTKTRSDLGLPMWTADDGLHAVVEANPAGPVQELKGERVRRPGIYILYTMGDKHPAGHYGTLEEAQKAAS